ncbi:Mss4-like protein [Hypoxylon crocopeplum]|nr:Mss4-like protein [Hypoxylon crocopeplum]
MSVADSTSTIRGSCLCGKIQYEMQAEPKNSALCFCNSCRKVTGTVAMANTWCPKENFKILSGAEVMKVYLDRSCDSGGCIERGFCAECGSTMISENREKFPGVVIVPVGSMDIDPAGPAWRPGTEYYCKRKAPWLATPEDTIKYEELF